MVSGPETGRASSESTTSCHSGTVCYRAGVRTITDDQLRDESTAILRDVQSGPSMIVTGDGMPLAELKPVSPRRFALRDEIARAAAGAPRVDSARFRADMDARVDHDVDVLTDD